MNLDFAPTPQFIDQRAITQTFTGDSTQDQDMFNELFKRYQLVPRKLARYHSFSVTLWSGMILIVHSNRSWHKFELTVMAWLRV